MRAVWIFVLLIVFATGALAVEAETNPDWCTDGSKDYDLRIDACTYLLDSSGLTNIQRAAVSYSRGFAYFEKGQFDRAIHDYSQAIALTPNDVDIYGHRGYVYHQEGQHDLAIHDFNRTIALNPNDALAYMNRGNAHADKGQNERAISDYNKAIALNPDEALAFYNRGRIHANTGKT